MIKSRSHPSHITYFADSDNPPLIFLTVCTKDRKKILDSNEVHSLLLDSWKQATNWSIGRYIVMPDHIHLFCCPKRPEYDIGKWIRYWKSISSKNWPDKKDQPIWQSDFWDTRLRNDESYLAKWNYVKNNPVRAGFVRKAEEWPYAGCINVLPWN